MIENIKFKCDGYKGKMYLFLDELNVIFKKKKWFLSSELVDVDTFSIRDIRENKGKYLIRQTDKNVEVITIKKCYILRFYSFEDANSFYSAVIDIKKSDTFLKRNLDRLRNINEKDVKNAANSIIKVLSFIALIVKAVDEMGDKGKTVIDGIKAIIDKRKK